MDLQSLIFAFMAGIFSLLSPCGYALLPGYISYYLGTRQSFGSGLSGGLICTLGIITIFTVVGALTSGLGTLLYPIIPLLDLVAGAVVTSMGIIILTGIRLPYVSLPTRISKRKGLIGFYIFGIAYGSAGVGCSAPIFLSVLFYAMAKGLIDGMLAFVTYAAGMGVPLVVTAVLVVGAKELVVRKIAKATLWLEKVSGILLVIVGLYLFYFYYSTYVA